MTIRNDKEVDRKSNVKWHDDTPEKRQNENLQDKWNRIQEEYLAKYPDMDTEALYFESGGLQGLLQKISELRGETIEEIRSEIENW